MKPDAAARELKRQAARLVEELKAAERLSLLDAHSEAVRLSSGTLTEEDLRRLDHPYATRHGSPRLAPGIINAQSGEFRAGWVARGPTQRGDVIRSTVQNLAPVAKYLEKGTEVMFARPLPELVEAELAPRRLRRIRAAVERALK